MSSSCASRASAPPPTPPARKCRRLCAKATAPAAEAQEDPRTPRPARSLDRQELAAYALRALGQRAHSTAELRSKLRQRAAVAADVEAVLSDLNGRGWLDDRQFAASFARYRAEHHRHGRFRIARDLRGKGVAEELITAALAEVFPDEDDERAMVRRRVERRLRGRRPPYSEKLLRSLYASLLRAGFPSAIIRDELFSLGARHLPEDSVVAHPEDG